MTYQEQIDNLKAETMEEIILFMIQVFKENANKSLTPDEVIKYYNYNKQLPTGVQASETQLKSAINMLFKNGTIKQENKSTGTYSKTVKYIYQVETPNEQLTLL